MICRAQSRRCSTSGLKTSPAAFTSRARSSVDELAQHAAIAQISSSASVSRAQAVGCTLVLGDRHGLSVPNGPGSGPVREPARRPRSRTGVLAHELADDGRTGRRVGGEVPAVDGVEPGEVGAARDEAERLDDVLEVAAGRPQRRPDVLDRAMHLRLEAALGDGAGVRVDTDAARR